MARASTKLRILRRKWYNAVIACYVRDMHGKRHGPYYGRVRGLSDNQVAVEAEGGSIYDATGLLVDIPKLGTHATYGQWPVQFEDAEKLSA